ncbi:hypothetical protein [Liquorilactobacillus oeni]|uniref:Acetyl-CoA carboxylase n=1 Tax=Liquorilactobacillus oeni DSM 19972 TaxID=1423777 RepID=A0A0R1MIY3_9LACO|nr:hypothetical protein [Liquorilactobacillus oeni]KRL05146.1 hypothetical protein FD46_GL001096 [Liquorilactobacillus oeni DSM 19972]
MNNDLDVICGRIMLLFKRVDQTRYWIQVANDPYDSSYNFFFNSQRRGKRLKSIPLHKLENYDLRYLEKIIDELKQETNLTIKFIGFADMRWPKTQKIIQWRRDNLE